MKPKIYLTKEMLVGVKDLGDKLFNIKYYLGWKNKSTHFYF